MTKARIGAVTLAALLSVCCASSGGNVEAPGDFKPAWFGLIPPAALAEPVVTPPAGAVIPLPAVPPGEDQGRGALAGPRVRQALQQVVGFAAAMRDNGSQMWGRISGFPSETATAKWLESEFNTIGLTGVAVQTYSASGDFWWPNSWEMRLLGDPTYGAQTIDVVLNSAVP